MWLKGKLSGQRKALKKHRLCEVYGSFRADVQEETNDNGATPADLWSEIAPTGNIYRVNALSTEHLKHREDLWEQLQKLGFELKEVLDAENIVPGDSGDLVDRRAVQLLQLLLSNGYTHGDEELEEGSKVPVAVGYPPLCEFLGPQGAERYLGGCLLLPKGHEAKESAFKMKLFALLIAAIQILGPCMIFLKNWFNRETNHFLDGDFWGEISWAEFTCLGSVDNSFVTCMGTLFLILIIEIVRNYAKNEKENCQKQRRLPGDRFWIHLGQLANMTSIFFTTLAMPVLFWAEMKPKDIVFDSLGLLFIFTLDDLAGEACGFLGLDDLNFQQLSSWNLALLSHCPVYLRDVVNLQATMCAEIWQIRVGPDGPLCSETSQPCKTRLARAADATTPLNDKADHSVLEGKAFDYWISSKYGQQQLPMAIVMSSLTEFLWYLLYFSLGVLEVLFPLVFFTLNKPCRNIRSAV